MQAEEANTPSRRVYFLIMMMYLDESNVSALSEEVTLRLGEFMDAISNPDILAECLNIQTYLVGNEFYKGLMTCRKLIDYEDERLGRHVAKGVSHDGGAG
ncbi:MAG: flagellar repressor protein FlbT [Caulobacter sp.]|nr:flagellar repressor protein FlbT [Caulobacter sp.]